MKCAAPAGCNTVIADELPPLCENQTIVEYFLPTDSNSTDNSTDDNSSFIQKGSEKSLHRKQKSMLVEVMKTDPHFVIGDSASHIIHAKVSLPFKRSAKR
jgi:hypothetical protein